MKIPPGRHSSASGNPEHGGRLAQTCADVTTMKPSSGSSRRSSPCVSRGRWASWERGRLARILPKPAHSVLAPRPLPYKPQCVKTRAPGHGDRPDSSTATFRPFDPSTGSGQRKLRDRKLKVLPPAPQFVSSRRATRAGHAAVSAAPGFRGSPAPSSLSVRPPCGPGVALLRLHFPSLRRCERGARAKGRTTLKGRREGGLAFLGM